MKKLFLLLLCLIIFPLVVCADVIPYKVYVCSSRAISSSEIKTGKLFSFHSIDKYELSDRATLEEGASVTVKINEYIQPKRGKRNGYAKIQVISYTIPSKGNERVSTTTDNLIGTLKLSSPLDKKELAKKAGVFIVGQALKFPGFSQAVAVSKGLIEPNEDQTRIQSAGKNLYESTPLTYSEKGHDLEIEKDSIVVISVKQQDQ